ncbi:hypothetical protein PG987_012096 [Apiospora arundinis]
MLFSSTAAQAFLLTLVGTALAGPIDLEPRAEKVIIGYRTASEAEAKQMNKFKTIVYDSKKAKGGKQNGDGVYLSQKLGEWPRSHLTDHYCVIRADKTKVEKAAKAWIKQDVEWNEKAVAKAITTLDKKAKPGKTLRLSKIKGKNYLQMVVPKGMVGTNLKLTHTKGALGFEAECKTEEEWNKGTKPADVNWKSGIFTKNFKGTAQ